MDTIFAPATAVGRAGLAVIRVSGPLARRALKRMCGPLPRDGRVLRKLLDLDRAVLDTALVLIFPQGHSFTGEETVELHLHGSRAVVAAVLRQLEAISGLRWAEPGEFTRQALENGRLDLAQAEGLADLIDAETEGQRRQAMRLLSGALGAKATHWREVLLRASALIAATIDFADDDVPVDVWPEVRTLVRSVAADLLAEAAGARMAERVRDGFEVAIVGAPNVGKSTLLNRLAGREAAITSTLAGTTRDVIEVRMELAGLAVTLLDTAGLREAIDIIEEIGIERGRERARAADIRIHLVDQGDPVLPNPGPDDLVYRAKSDVNGFPGGVSGLTGTGVDEMVAAVAERLRLKAESVGLATQERHRYAMDRAAMHLSSVDEMAEMGAELVDVIAEEMRLALRAVDRLVGRVDVEDILGEVFARFCIGK
jgi:tRNA modification GTPase